MTWLGLLNFVVLQWFGVRLARCSRLVRVPPGVESLADLDDSAWAPDGYRVLRWIWPLTGWWSECRWIARRR